MSVSWPQNFLSSRGGVYCEEMLLTVGLKDSMIWRRETPLKDVPYLQQPHIDSLKVRLFSPCSKEHEGKDEPNPAIGKARQMHGMLSWLGGGFESLTPLFSARWEQRMKGFLPSSLAFRYLPVKLGGIEAPAYHCPRIVVEQAIRSLPDYHLWAIKQVLDGTAGPMISRCLASFATNARARGISADQIEDQIRDTLLQADLVRGVDDPALFKMALDRGLLSQENLGAGQSDPVLVWSNLRYRDKAALAKRMRLLDVHEAIDLIGRPYLFRDLLFPEVSRRHGIDPYRTKQYESVPWSKRQTKFHENLLWNLPTSDVSITTSEKETLISSITDWCVENRPLNIPREVYFFPEGVVVHKNLVTLRTPL
jgi:hypothetical protein